MKRELLFLLTYIFIGIGLVTAQNTKISGIVTSADDGEPIIGASVLVKGTSVGTITDVDGKFTIQNVPSMGKLLIISYVGMKEQEVLIKPFVTVVLTSDAELLEEVVVTGMQRMDKRLFTGAATSLSNETPITTLLSPEVM